MNYKKLRRSGRLYRSLGRMYSKNVVVLYSMSPYATQHQLGGSGAKPVTVKGAKVKTEAKGVRLGPNSVARPFMTPSMRTLGYAHKLLKERMRKNGW